MAKRNVRKKRRRHQIPYHNESSHARNVKTCEDCVHHKFYPGVMKDMCEMGHQIETYKQANTCEDYDNDSWVK